MNRVLRTAARPTPAGLLLGCLAALPLLLCGRPCTASDHADPIMIRQLEGGLTGLFAFPRDQHLVIVLCVRRALTDGTTLQLAPYRYTIHLDTHSEVNFEDLVARARYGGQVVEPDGIRPDVSIRLQLNDDASLNRKSLVGLPEPDRVRIWTGVRDDPFIFHRFSRTNVVAMVVQIPFDQFREHQRDWLIWGTSERLGRQVDHVGRSLRTMLPRMDFLNTLPPHEHVPEIRRRHTNPGVLQDILSSQLSPLFAIRHYDFEPDVMIFSRRFPPGYPNGRRLEDDVAKLCCEQGDCLLFELSTADAEADHQTRPTTNNKPFLEQFPYLAEPNANTAPPPQPGLRTRTKVILGLAGLAVGAFLVLPWYLYWRCRRSLWRLRQMLPSPGPVR